ncbi:MAG: hypothetical protein ACPGYK_07635 [Flavobacteriales bacterium]
MKRLVSSALWARLVVCLCALIASTSVWGQSLPDRLSGGVRIGLSSGLTAKLYTDDASEALEAIVSFRGGALNVTALYAFHRSDFNIDGLRWYLGGGAQAVLFPQSSEFPLGLAIDGILGLEYVLPDAPLLFSIDYKPAFFLIGDPGLQNGGGLSCRYFF